ncbi:alpha/beta hydrolase [Paenibacillus sp. M1]|uniref:Alpha/beta hydrolase n=1 Tax=Paenibacillus haidiansis TaxID=1574488 RepID=A0ABU7VQT8_9BACL
MDCILELDSTTVHYEVHGTGYPILMIHGFGCDRRLMTGCMEPVFAERPGWKRIYLDLPGMGRTKGTDRIRSTDDMLAVVEQFADKAMPGQSFAVAGESYGGYLARALVSKRPEQVGGMALICPVTEQAEWNVPPFKIVYRDQEAIARMEDVDGSEDFLAIQVVQDDYNWERFKAEILCGLRAADAAFLERIRERYRLSDDPGIAAEPYPKPVLILTGRHDHLVGYKNQWNCAETYPRASFAMLDRAGHNLQIEQPRLFHALVGEWLDRVEECSPG